MRYKVEVAEEMILKAEGLEVDESEYICYKTGQPRTVELQELLKARFPNRDYEVIDLDQKRTRGQKKFSGRCDLTAQAGLFVLASTLP